MLSPNEIRSRALAFHNEWVLETKEDAEAKSFWDDFFEVFGITRRRVASFEHPIKKADGSTGFADLLWKGVLIVEHKSRGKSLETAYKQAIEYFPGLKDAELPRYIIVSDFEKFRVYDLEKDEQVEFPTRELHTKIDLFGFISGHENTFDYVIEEAANVEAAELMAEFHEQIKKTGYGGADLETFLIRILFCLFADDTGMFPKNIFRNYIDNRTGVDGSDLGPQLAQIFQVLNTPEKDRQSNLDEDLAKFPYVNGGIFSDNISILASDVSTKIRLIKCCGFDWSAISAAIFGSLFQGVMKEEVRRHLGAHYTSEQNILKLIRSLFLDDLYIELDEVRYDSRKLDAFHTKLGNLKFLDPACGCGNFLVIAYRELRILEMEILKIKSKNGEKLLEDPRRITIGQFYGIEIEEFPARIAEVAMHLIDHQMNIELDKMLGRYIVEFPIKNSATIKHANALSFDWNDLVSSDELSYILGNPPFVGAMMMTEEQRSNLVHCFNDANGVGVLDFVTAWYAKAATYIQNSRIKVAFVSTNSISQGEQVGILWKYLKDFNIIIHFAHQTFRWSNDAPGVAAVYCVIIGFGAFEVGKKFLYEYERVDGESKEREVKQINAYLLDAEDILIENRNNPICDVPNIIFGNMPRDGGHLLLDDQEKESLIQDEPQAEKWVKPFISAKEFLHNEKRWCLWLVEIEPQELRAMPKVLERVEKVKEFRLASKAASTRNFAKTPSLFAQLVQPDSNYVVIPSTSSENREYIPMGFFTRDDIVSNSCHAVVGASLFDFGVLESKMHMAWVKYVCGRLESRYRYSKDIVYNNFPWPKNVSEDKKKKVEECVDKLLFIRNIYSRSSLADLYDPNAMPSDLREAHENLDRAVEGCYGKRFKTDQERVSFLFNLYKEYTSKQLKTVKKVKPSKKTKTISSDK